MPNDEKIVKANGVDLCVQTFGDVKDPAILLIHGASASMLWWEAELCEKIAAGGRFVIRFDNRDTGKSVSYPTGQPGYSLRDMTEDALGILDVLGIQRAHLVGRSMAGAIISLAGIDYADRVASLTFVSTTPGGGDLPPMSDEFMEYTSQNPDPSDSKAVVDFITGLMKVYSGGSPYYDEKAMRAIAEADVARADNIASTLTNHFVINFDGPEKGGLGDITAPTLVVHGEKDPVFPLPHGEALRDRIPGAELLIMEKAGHEVPEPLWDVFATALIKHSAV
ncbi:alpha/beta fold hydrolase [Amycolatopsis sp. H20-H5]|uniref:alpha/beta fold hydrolase n=1 Tax=Amycolatopsis sp. H20-H5 TaxID=3046309 RepID=UPI002DBC41A7|nr:alpha/beta hydrolase [Amycolatopsis sp. H20-H5]MEC3976901.1 alpha/beta hydrolase [Amycolatopsis sp. H20-H5]